MFIVSNDSAKKKETSANWWRRLKENAIIYKNYVIGSEQYSLHF